MAKGEVNPEASHIDLPKHDEGQVKDVMSAALTDALAKDNQRKWSWASIRLYGVIAVTGLGN